MVISTINQLSEGLKEGDDPGNPAALPDDALVFLERLCRAHSVQRVVEFGSGRSTRKFLEMGLEVASIEDSDEWMKKTLATLDSEQLTRHSAFVEPLRLKWLHGYPVKDWEMTSEISKLVCGADLVLIDSPYFTGFRESTLVQVLNRKPRVVALDDVRIPGMLRFCKRIARQSKDVSMEVAHVGHRFAIFELAPSSSVRNSASLLERLRGWRRYVMYKRFSSAVSTLA